MKKDLKPCYLYKDQGAGVTVPETYKLLSLIICKDKLDTQVSNKFLYKVINCFNQALTFN